MYKRKLKKTCENPEHVIVLCYTETSEKGSEIQRGITAFSSSPLSSFPLPFLFKLSPLKLRIK
jgi:hypothetical protein